MDREQLVAKNEALLERIEFFVDRNVYDPRDVLPFFDMWLPQRVSLRETEDD